MFTPAISDLGAVVSTALRAPGERAALTPRTLRHGTLPLGYRSVTVLGEFIAMAFPGTSYGLGTTPDARLAVLDGFAVHTPDLGNFDVPLDCTKLRPTSSARRVAGASIGNIEEPGTVTTTAWPAAFLRRTEPGCVSLEIATSHSLPSSKVAVAVIYPRMRREN